MAFSPLRPLPRPHTEPREPISPLTLQQLALEAVPNPGETTRQLLPPWHCVTIQLEQQEYQEMREEYRKEREKIQVCYASGTKQHQVAPISTKLHQAAPITQIAQKCTKSHQAAPISPSSTKLHQGSQNCTNLHQLTPNSTKVQQNAPSCTKLYQVAPSCTIKRVRSSSRQVACDWEQIRIKMIC